MAVKNRIEAISRKNIAVNTYKTGGNEGVMISLYGRTLGKSNLLILLLLVFGMFSGVVQGAPIHDAATKGDLAKVKMLVGKNHSLVNSKDKDGTAPLHCAVAKGRKSVVEYLLSMKANVNQPKNNGVTPLHVAAALGQTEMVELLLANKAEINAKDKSGRTPLVVARANGQDGIAVLLLAHGAADVATTPISSGQSQSASPSRISDMKALGEQLAGCLVNGEYSRITEKFDARMSSSLSADQLGKTWQSLLEQVGPFKRQVSTRMTKKDGFDIVIVTCQFDKAMLDLLFTFNTDMQICGFFIVPAGQSSAEYKAPGYVNPASFTERQVMVGSGELALPATLTMPVGKRPFRCHSSGSRLWA